MSKDELIYFVLTKYPEVETVDYRVYTGGHIDLYVSFYTKDGENQEESRFMDIRREIKERLESEILGVVINHHLTPFE